MNQEKDLEKMALFEGQKIRRVLVNDEWWFSVVDVCGVLSGSGRPKKYWNDLKQKIDNETFEQASDKIGRFKNEAEFQLSTFCRQLKLISSDGKMRTTDCANTEGILRIIQSIPSPKAEPFKRWLAKVGYERLQEIENPELAMDRMKAIYEKKGYPKDWIDKRARGIAVRHSLTDEWRDRGIKRGSDYAILTNEIMEGTFGLKVTDYKNLKGLDRENLRDHMEDMELILTMLGEATTTEIHRTEDSQGFNKLRTDSREGGEISGEARQKIEKRLKRPIIKPGNFLGRKNIEIQ